ncbi:MAG: CHAT domain-containing protein [Vicinamibacteria bacterium]
MKALRPLLVLTALAPLAAAAEEPALLAPGASVTRTLGADEVHRFRLLARAGQYVLAPIEQAGIEVSVTARGPDGAVVLETASPNTPLGPNPVAFVATSDGLHELAIRQFYEWRAGGTYTLSLDAVREPTGEDRARAEAVAVSGRWAALLRKDDTRREALPLVEDAIARWRALGDERMEMWTAMSLASGVMAVQGDARRSADVLERPLRLAVALRDDYAEARIRYNLAQAVRRLGRFAEARALFERSAVLHRAGGRLGDLSNVQRSYAALLADAGYDQESLDLTYEALASAQAGGAPERIARATLALAHAFIRLNEPAAALETLDRPLPGFDRDGQGRAAVWMCRGTAHRALGDDDRAYEAWLEAYEGREALGNRSEIAEVLMRLADVHRDAGEWEPALALGLEADRMAEAVGDRTTRAAGTCRLGRTHLASGVPAAAAEAFRLTLELAGETNANARLCATVGLGQAALAAGDLAQGLRFAEDAVALVESRRGGLANAENRAGLLSRNADAYEVLVDAHMRLHAIRPDAGHAAAALTAAEAGRARSLLEVIVEGRGDSGTDGARARPFDAAALQRALDPDTLLLEYALGEEASYLWVVSADAIRAYPLPPRAVIRAALRPVRARLASPVGAGAHREEDARHLGGLLLGAAAGQLGDKRLLVAAADVLQYLPFAALPDPRSPAGAPLLARHEVVQVPSASTAAVIRQEARRAPGTGPLVRVLADPVYERQDPRIAGAVPRRTVASAGPARLALRGGALARLPFSRLEADAIARSAGPGRAESALGFAATRASVMGPALRTPRILHFATHGIVDSAHPARTGIVLSLFDRQGRAQDGFLSLRDVYGLRLSADLVVLSACETALGRDLRGEGLVGLTTGFLHAGARQVVASLWRVDDLATSELMTRFYRRLLREGLGAPAALRAAQLEMAADRRWRDPYFWAGFVVQGDWR